MSGEADIETHDLTRTELLERLYAAEEKQAELHLAVEVQSIEIRTLRKRIEALNARRTADLQRRLDEQETTDMKPR